jgi:hypothetical protein
MYSWSESQLAEDGLAVVEITVPALGDAPEWDGWHLEFEGRTPVEGAEGATFRVIRDIMSRFPNEQQPWLVLFQEMILAMPFGCRRKEVL